MYTASLTHDFHIDQLDPVVGRSGFVIDQRDDIGVEDMLLAIRKVLKANEGFLEGVVAEVVAQFTQLILERGPSLNACPSPASSL